MEVVPGGILFRRRACVCPQYRQDLLITGGPVNGLAGSLPLATGLSADGLPGAFPLSGIG